MKKVTMNKRATGSQGLQTRRSASTVAMIAILVLGSTSFLLIAPSSSRTAHADTLETTIPIAGVPSYEAVNPTTNTIYVSGSNEAGTNSTVSVIDGATNTVTATIVAGGYCAVCGSQGAIAVDPQTNRVYVAVERTQLYSACGCLTGAGGTLVVIDGSTNKIIDSINVISSPIPGLIDSIADVAVDPNSNAVYVATSDGLVVVNGSTDAIATTVLPNLQLSDIAVNPVTDTVYVTGFTTVGYMETSDIVTQWVYVLDGATNALITSISFGSPAHQPTEAYVTVDPVTDTVYVALPPDFGYAAINGETGTATVVSQSFETTGLTVDPATNELYVTPFNANDDLFLYVLNGSTGTFLQTLPITSEVQHIAVDPATNALYLAGVNPNGVNPPDTGTVTVVSGGSSSSSASQLTVNTQTTNGTAITGYYSLLYENGSAVETGYSPDTFGLTDGQAYVLQVNSYGPCYFSHWADTGSTNSWRYISISSDTQLTAIYNCSGTSSSSVTVFAEGFTNHVSRDIFGYYVTLFSSNGSVVSTGFAPKTFPTVSGQNYTLQADNYGSCALSGWEAESFSFGEGGSGDSVTFTASSGALDFSAIYTCTAPTNSTGD
jgi:DNA-binding beta-propeller fold protein YncE